MRKLLRFVTIYGIGRSLFKVAGRLRIDVPALWPGRRAARDIGIIGCGQFAFATIAYFLRGAFGARIAACHDIDACACDSFARSMRVPARCGSVEEVLAQPGLRTIYIASNHASHAPYAAAALERGLDVYVEKPVAVSHDQLVMLVRAVRASSGRIYAGYNRPFAGAIRELRRRMRIDPAQGISMQCFVSGHRLGEDHWYRRPEEGTRVCGNIGHWLDLMVHVYAWRGLPDRLEISMLWAQASEPDDNVTIAISSDRGDVFSIMMSSRSEPFEGINETINLQHADTICKIDDFRRMTLWQGPRLVRRRYWPKDVGHRRAILQPFRSQAPREWQEVILSTLLMLHIAQMVRERRKSATFSFKDSLAQLSQEILLQEIRAQ